MAIPNPSSGSLVERPAATPTWGLGDVIVGWLLAFGLAALVGGMVVAAAGYSDHPKDLPLGLAALANLPLWLGFVGVPIWAAAVKGNGWITDFHVAIRPWDVPIGIGAGLAAQLIVVNSFGWAVTHFTSYTSDDLSKPAQDLADKAHGAGGAILFLVIVGLFAPLAEELFFRGLLFRSIEKRSGQWWALGVSSVVFGATHFEPLQFVPLAITGAIFGLLVIRTGRLGPSILAHMAFNCTAVVGLLWLNN